MIKITFMGAGSTVFARNVLGDCMCTPALRDGVIALYDIDEEAATGTSNGALTYYFYLNDIIGKKADCKIIQGEKMERPSVILTDIAAEGENCLIKVGGSGVILAEGKIHL